MRLTEGRLLVNVTRTERGSLVFVSFASGEGPSFIDFPGVLLEEMETFCLAPVYLTTATGGLQDGGAAFVIDPATVQVLDPPRTETG